MSSKFENKSVFKLILCMGIPPILSMLIQSLYAIVDGWYVAKISEEAFNAVSIVYPIQTIILSIAVGMGIAINGAIARSLGRSNEQKAKEFCILGVIFTIINYLLIIVIALIIINPFINATTTIETASMAKSYISIISFCSVGVLFHLTFEKILQGYGNMIIPTIAQIVGCLLNILLDHVFVLVLGFGVTGAAYATVISQCFGALILGIYIVINKKYSISFKNANFSKDNIKEIYKVFIPSAIMLSLPSILIIILNSILTHISVLYVNILNLYLKIQTFVFMPVVGLLQGVRPIISYYYGANKPTKVKRTLQHAIVLTTIVMALGTIVFLLIPEFLIKIYFDSGDIVKEGTIAFRIFSISFVFVGVSYLANTFYEAVGYGLVSLIINLSRQFLLTIILSLLFVYVFDFGAVGVWYSFIIAEIFTAFAVCCMFIYTYKNSSIFIKKPYVKAI